VNLSVRFLYYTCKSLYRTSTQIAGKHPATSTFSSQIFFKFKVRDGRNPYCMSQVMGANCLDEPVMHYGFDNVVSYISLTFS